MAVPPGSSDVAPACRLDFGGLASTLTHAMLPFLNTVIRRHFAAQPLGRVFAPQHLQPSQVRCGHGCALANARHGPRVAHFSMASRRYPAVCPTRRLLGMQRGLRDRYTCAAWGDKLVSRNRMSRFQMMGAESRHCCLYWMGLVSD